MTIRVQCPACKAKYEVNKDLDGRVLQCRKCSGKIKVNTNSWITNEEISLATKTPAILPQTPEFVAAKLLPPEPSLPEETPASVEPARSDDMEPACYKQLGDIAENLLGVTVIVCTLGIVGCVYFAGVSLEKGPQGELRAISAVALGVQLVVFIVSVFAMKRFVEVFIDSARNARSINKAVTQLVSHTSKPD